MKTIRIALISLSLSVIVLAVCFFVPQCLAMNTGFSTEDIESPLAESVIHDLGIMSITYKPDISKGFSCFDVNEAGNILLGFDVNGRDVVLAYDSNTNFLYGFSLKDNGAFGLEWDGDDIIVYRMRSDLAIRLNSRGECQEIKHISNTLDNQNYWRDEVYASKRLCGNNVFTAKSKYINSDFLRWGTYTCLHKVSPSGEQIVLFDYSRSNTGIGIVFAFSASTIIVLSFVIVARRKKRG